MPIDDFVSEINALRKSNSGWYTWIGTVDGRSVAIKGYQTWLQIFRVDGINHSGISDISVAEFKNTLRKPFN